MSFLSHIGSHTRRMIGASCSSSRYSVPSIIKCAYKTMLQSRGNSTVMSRYGSTFIAPRDLVFDLTLTNEWWEAAEDPSGQPSSPDGGAVIADNLTAVVTV